MRRCHPRWTLRYRLSAEIKVENGTDPIVEYFRKGSAASHLGGGLSRHYFASAHLHLSGVAAALSASSYELLDHAAAAMKAQGKRSLSIQPASGAVEKRSGNGRKA
jgi:sugar/nucleoside kinase (ribokinase family)